MLLLLLLLLTDELLWLLIFHRSIFLMPIKTSCCLIKSYNCNTVADGTKWRPPGYLWKNKAVKIHFLQILTSISKSLMINDGHLSGNQHNSTVRILSKKDEQRSRGRRIMWKNKMNRQKLSKDKFSLTKIDVLFLFYSEINISTPKKHKNRLLEWKNVKKMKKRRVRTRHLSRIGDTSYHQC